ncbi:MAG: hypothetical protein IPM71_07260 [Bacteroidota bacterium]|nr:MAG: hypothetical protein IPM71_07260 [Bacteroidota bacterium]
MKANENAEKLRLMIEKAIEDHVITRSEMDKIVNLATADSVIDAQEQILLDQLHDMIENKVVKLVP